MPIVVGFVPTKEGRAALARAAEESALRSTKLVIVNSHRGGRDAVDVGPESPTEKELASVLDDLKGRGIDTEVHALVRGNEPAEDLIAIQMTQLMPSGAYPIRPQLQQLVYAAIED